MNNSTKNIIRVLAILAVGIALSAIIVTSKPAPAPVAHQPEPPHPAEVIKVALTSDSITVNSQGTVKAKINIDVTAQVSGQVVEVSPQFAAGGFFDSGETLLQIDPRDYQIKLTAAQSRLAEAKKLLATEKSLALQARREWRDLGDQQANELFLRKPQVAAAEAGLKAAEGEVLQAQLNLERSTLSLPFAGRVANTQVNLGQFVPAGATIGRVYASDVMEVRLPVTALQTRLLNLQLDSHAIAPLPVTLSLQVGKKVYQWQGQVVRFEPQADTASRLFYVIAEVKHAYELYDEAHPPLVPGTFVEAYISSTAYDSVVILPREALYQMDKVMVLDDEHHLQATPVEVLEVNDQRLVVRGLQAGQLVLAKPPGFVELGVEYEPVIVNPVISQNEAQL